MTIHVRACGGVGDISLDTILEIYLLPGTHSRKMARYLKTQGIISKIASNITFSPPQNPRDVANPLSWDPWGTLWCPVGEPWGRLGTLGASWEVLGGPVGALRTSWGPLGVPLEILGGPGGDLRIS